MSTSYQPSLGLRSSCDRCRVQKLRCSPSSSSSSSSSSDSDSCQRCARAQVPCIFSRRARSGRRAKNSSGLEIAHSSGPDPYTTSVGSVNGGDIPSATFSSASSVASPAAEQSAPSVPSGGACATWNMESNSSGEVGYSDPAPSWWSGSEAPGPELDILLDNAIFDLDQSLQAEQHDVGPLNLAEDMPFMPHIGFPLGNSRDSESLATHVPDLTALLTATHKYSRDLREHREAKADMGDAQCIYDYPIGDAAYLAQWFLRILSKCEAGFEDASLGLEVIPCAGREPLDAPSLLLIVSWYMTMVGIYRIVFRDMHENFLTLPDSTSARTELHCGLRLGDLPLENEACARTLRAVDMLLGALDTINGALGFVWDHGDGLVNSLLKRQVAREAPSHVQQCNDLITQVKQFRSLLGRKLGAEERI